jgi:cytochrome P460
MFNSITIGVRRIRQHLRTEGSNMQRTYKRPISIVVIVTAILTTNPLLGARSNEAVPYPTGFLKWTHIKQATQSAETSPNNKTLIYHIYANEQAVEGYRNNKQFADGSVLVVDFFETKDDNGKLVETSRAQVAVMVKNSQRHAQTGGWGFEQFKGDSQTESMLKANGAARCFACHGQKEAKGGVFTIYNK